MSSNLTDVELETTLGASSSDTSSSLTLRSAGYAHLSSTYRSDVFGNATDTIDLGTTGDETITKHTSPARPNSDPGGWMWRTVESYSFGSVNTSPRNDIH